MAVSHIMLESYKKYVLVALILHGKVQYRYAVGSFFSGSSCEPGYVTQAALMSSPSSTCVNVNNVNISLREIPLIMATFSGPGDGHVGGGTADCCKNSFKSFLCWELPAKITGYATMCSNTVIILQLPNLPKYTSHVISKYIKVGQHPHFNLRGLVVGEATFF